MEDLEQTHLWTQYEKGVNFNRLRNMYTDTDRNHRFYNGDQWAGLQSGSIEPVSFNIIKPIVKHKVGTINSNLWAINYSAENVDEFRKEAKEVCELLNKKSAQLFDKDQMGQKIRRVTKKACINSEGLIYVNYEDDVTNEITSKNDVCYGNENSDDIQGQPHIIIKKRRPVSEIKEIFKAEKEKNGETATEEELELITGDQEYTEEAGDSAKQEVNDMCIVLTKMYKEDGIVHFDMATRHVEIKKHKKTGLTLYPLAHMVWEEVEGSSRGEGIVKYLIPNQIEINRTLMRRALTVKMNAYPKQIINTKAISNPEDADKIGVTLKTADLTVEDVRKLFASTTPSTMSTDARELQSELVGTTRELEGAGDVATGAVNPEKASGRAILAVKQASEMPLTEQTQSVKTMLEDLAKIYLDMWKVYSIDEMVIFTENEEDPEGEEIKNTIPVELLNKLQASVSVDITPKSPFDKYAQEMSLENLFTNKHLNFEEYVDLLDHDSVMPKVKLEAILKKREEKQMQIAEMESQAMQMQSEVDQMIGGQEDINQIEQMGNQVAEQAM